MSLLACRPRRSHVIVLALVAANCGSDHQRIVAPTALVAAHSTAMPATAGVSALSSNGGEVEFKGKVESVGSSQFKVFGVTVMVDAKTEFDGDGLRAVTDLQVGEFVHVHGRLLASGSVLATEVQRDDDRVEFNGKVTVVGSDRIKVGEVVVVVSTSTRVLVDCNGASMVDIKNDQMVKVTGTLQGDGTVIAVQVNVSINVSVEVICRAPRPTPRPSGGGDDDDD